MKNTKKRAAARPARRQTAYTGPLHQEQYITELLKVFDAGAFVPGRIYDIGVIHEQDDDGRVAEIVIREVPEPSHE
jgi:hypothetical protein